ncbi:hypothetical protein ABVT39_008832 [Epinephelus coioides]
MEKRALSGSGKRKQRKEKEAKDAALVQQIPSISTFFTRKVGQDYGAHSSGANTTGHRDDLQDANTASSSSPEMFSSGGAALPPTDTVADNACSTTAGSSRAAEPGQPELSPLTSPAEDEMLAAGNEPESAVPQRDDDEDSWCETVTDPALWGNISSDKNMRSPVHMSNMLTLMQRMSGTGAIDSALRKQTSDAREYWRGVLRRVVAVIKFLGERGLAFRGNDELLGSPHNGNYLGILELISQFDPFLAEHIKTYGQKGRGSVSYLSSTICEEFIDMMGEKTRQVIAEELRDAKYFSVIVDSTPDLSHVDQLTFIFRFVSKQGNIVERFLAFEPIQSHTGQSLADCVIAMVENLGLDLSNCRGQSFDNASNMSGRYNGLQAHLKQRNPLIHYVPCAAHSLNLVGVNSIEASSLEVGQYFDLLQSLYTFCAASTHRWERVFRNSDIDLTLKSLSNTRWSCRADSTKALWQNYVKIREALESIAEDETEKRDTRSEASTLAVKLNKLETAFMANFWNTILTRFQLTSLQLQKADIELMTAVRLLRSLREFVSAQRDLFTDFEKEALAVPGVCQTYKYDLQRTRKRKRFEDDSAEKDAVFDGKSKFQIETFSVAIDKLVSCLSHRIDAYKHLCDLFGVLFMPENTSDRELIDKANTLASAYPADLDSNLGNELIHFRSFIRSDGQNVPPSKCLKTILDCGLQSTFPNVYIAVRLYLTLPVTNCEGERSFSQMARIKNELRTKMTQRRFNSLSLMAIEAELVRELDFDDLIKDFSSKKARKKPVV